MKSFFKSKYFPAALLFLWMLVIFLFSMENGDESEAASTGIIGVIGRMIYTDFEAWPLDAQLAFVEKISYPIRKAAHMTEYAILGMLGLWTFRSWRLPQKRAAWFALLCSALYAATDEFHQLFVPGRSGQITDVLFDTTGACLGIGLVLFALVIRKKRGRHKNADIPQK